MPDVRISPNHRVLAAPLHAPRLSRRACLPLLASVLLAPAAAPARAQAWQTYRRADLGFEVEMPGKPTVEERVDEFTKERIFSAEVQHDGVLFGASYQEFKLGISLKQEIEAQHQAADYLNGKVVRETALEMNNIPGREFVIDTDGAVLMLRFYFVKDRRIGISVSGDRSVHERPAVRRFVDSFKLLPTAAR
jgi:hypothetical protein